MITAIILGTLGIITLIGGLTVKACREWQQDEDNRRVLEAWMREGDG